MNAGKVLFASRNLKFSSIENASVIKSKSRTLVDLEGSYGAHNYNPIPVVLSKGQGVYVWDVEGKEYLDFLSAYSAVNQGHCHPRILATFKEQADQLTLTSRAFYNDKLGSFCQFMSETFKYDRVLPMNSGVEACETAVKLARRWAYRIKKVPPMEAKVVFAEENFWGRSLAAVSSSTDPVSYEGFGPFMPGFELIPYNNLEALENLLSKDPTIAAFMVEPVQGEAGVKIPHEEYFKGVRALCDKYDVLFIADEVQTGLGRTGSLLASEGFGVRPDVLCLGKALSGGMMPVSAVLASDEVMLTIRPGEHGSTYGGNPLACSVATTAVKVLLEEGMIENSKTLGARFLKDLQNMCKQYAIVKEVRGRGLMLAIELSTPQDSPVAWELCMKLSELGLLAKPTHGNVVRLTPPLVITSSQIDSALERIQAALTDLKF